jgi:hypothetical protein
MIGVTSGLLLMRDIRQKAQIKRIFKELKSLQNGKETEGKTEEAGEDTDRNKSPCATPKTSGR